MKNHIGKPEHISEKEWEKLPALQPETSQVPVLFKNKDFSVLDIKFRFEEIEQSMKHILIPLLVVIFLMLPISALALSGEATSQPDRMVKTQGKVQYRYNIHEIQRETMEGNATVWTYDYVEVQPPATKAKVKQAIRGAKSSEAGVADVEEEMTAAQQRLQQLSQHSYAQIDNYIENNVTNLASAKAVMKIMAKAIIAITKQLDL